MQYQDDTTAQQMAPERASSTSKVGALSRGWLIVGGLAVLFGAAMGFIMSSLGK